MGPVGRIPEKILDMNDLHKDKGEAKPPPHPPQDYITGHGCNKITDWKSRFRPDFSCFFKKNADSGAIGGSRISNRKRIQDTLLDQHVRAS